MLFGAAQSSLRSAARKSGISWSGSDRNAAQFGQILLLWRGWRTDVEGRGARLRARERHALCGGKIHWRGYLSGGLSLLYDDVKRCIKNGRRRDASDGRGGNCGKANETGWLKGKRPARSKNNKVSISSSSF